MLKVSIIIPIYNVEKYVTEAIESVINQTMEKSEYEIILINNGTEDSSGEIAKRYQDMYENITLVSYKRNRTLCSALNTGLKLARGKYVYILHSDDIMDSNLLETCYGEMEKHELEVLYLGHRIMYDNNEINYYLEDGTEMLSEKIPSNVILTGHDVLEKDIWLGPEFVYFFNRKFLYDNNLFFNENSIIEDLEFMPRLFIKINKFMKIDKVLHSYRVRKNNCTDFRNVKMLKNEIKGVKACIDFLLEFVMKENFKEQRTLNVLREYFFHEFNSLILYIGIFYEFGFEAEVELEVELVDVINKYFTNYKKVFKNPMTENEYTFCYKIAKDLLKNPNMDNLNNYKNQLNDVAFGMLNEAIKKADNIK